MKARALVGLCALACGACGSGAPELPAGLGTERAGCSAPDYPDGTYGTEPGELLENSCFAGFRAPAVVAPSPSTVETLAFSDFYDPVGTRGVKLLLVNTAAIWCSACVSEHRTLPDHARELEGRGLVILGTLFQDARHEPATLDDVERWVENFDTNFPMVGDPTLQMGQYGDPAQAPLNLVVDAKNMVILRKFVGDQASVMWPYLEAALAQR